MNSRSTSRRGWNLSTAAITAGLLGLIATGSRAQTKPRAEPSFEVSSVRPYSASGGPVSGASLNFGEPGGQVVMRQMTLGVVVRYAFGLRESQLRGPSWLATDYFDIQANVPASASKDDIPVMFQRLLRERFNLQYRLETRMERVYALTTRPEGPKLTRSSSPYESKDKAPEFPQTVGGFGRVKLSRADGSVRHLFEGISMSQLALFLSQGQLDMPVYDATGIEGYYRIELDIALRRRAVGDIPEPSGPSIQESLRRLGLDLVARRTAVTTFVIDHIERIPTPN